MWPFTGIKSKLLLAFAGFLIVITLLNAGLASYLTERQSGIDALDLLSQQLIRLQADLQRAREDQLAVAEEAASDDKNLSDMAMLSGQDLALRRIFNPIHESASSLNKAISLNRFQLILRSARLSNIAIYFQGELSHYVTEDEAGMIRRRGAQSALTATTEKDRDGVRLDNWREWPQHPRPLLVAGNTPVVDHVTVSFDFPAAQMMVLRVVVPIQGFVRTSPGGMVAEELTIATPATLRQPDARGALPTVIGLFVFSKIIDPAFLKETAVKAGVMSAVMAADGQSRLQLVDMTVPAEFLSAGDDQPVRPLTLDIGGTPFYQALKRWRPDGQPVLILGSALSREPARASIRRTVIGIIAASGLILAIGAAFGYGLISRMVAPIKALTAAAASMEANVRVGKEKALHGALGRYLESPVVSRSHDEIRELASAFNTMAGRLHTLVGDLAQENLERRQAEEALRRSEEQWRDVFENNPTMYFMVDEAGAVMAVNPFGAEQLGYGVDDLVGQPVLNVFYEPDREAVQRNLAVCLAQLGSAHSWEARKVRRDGSVLRVRDTAKAVSRASGPIVLVAGEDITERKRAEEALRQAQAELAHVSRVTTLGEMAASIAHEVDQPLSGVVINANACLRFLAGLPPNIGEVRDGLQAIARDGRRASDVIARIRALARRAATEKELLDMNEVIREVITLAEGEARRARARLRVELAGDLPRVLGDTVELQQVVLNLLLNGLEAMTTVVGRPRELVIRTEREANDHVHVAVQDVGSGIDPKVAAQIFSAFYTTKRSGMGMGLSISRSIVEQHGGRLWAVPNDGPGTTFHFTV
jgi:PAS domain S-box-containing protein